VFPDKKSQVKIMHLIYRVAAELPQPDDPAAPKPAANPSAPVIVYMDECERFFEAGGKKVKVDKNGPTRIKKDLATYKNGYKPNDRIIFIGCSREPNKMDKKDGPKFWDKYLHVPYPDYQTRLQLWQQLVKDELALGLAPGDATAAALGDGLAAVDLSTLARISDGFSAGALRRVVKKTLTKKRVARLEKRKLDGAEFINALALEAAANQVTFAADSQVFNDFTDTITGLASRRSAIEAMLNPDAGGGKDKKGGKKKK